MAKREAAVRDWTKHEEEHYHTRARRMVHTLARAWIAAEEANHPLVHVKVRAADGSSARVWLLTDLAVAKNMCQAKLFESEHGGLA